MVGKKKKVSRRSSVLLWSFFFFCLWLVRLRFKGLTWRGQVHPDNLPSVKNLCAIEQPNQGSEIHHFHSSGRHIHQEVGIMKTILASCPPHRIRQWTAMSFNTGWQVTFKHNCKISGGKVFSRIKGQPAPTLWSKNITEDTLETAGRPVWPGQSD